MKKPGWLKNIRVLIWDLDKTLYRDDPELQKQIKKEIYLAVAKNKKWSLEKAKREFEKIHRLKKASTETLFSLGLDGIKIFDEVFSIINWDKYLNKDKRLTSLFSQLKRFQHYLVTNNKAKFTNKKLILLGLDKNLFKEIINLHSFGFYKPDPRAFKLVLDKTRFPPEKHLSIGDKESTDIIPAKKLGIRTCLVWRKGKTADLSVDSVYHLSKLLN